MLKVAIIDYCLGNLLSVHLACKRVGLIGEITKNAQTIEKADAVILPGVGAFGDAMEALKRLDLVSPIKDFAASGKPLIGICLGFQLLMSHSEEFGNHEGLGLIEGDVVSLRKLHADEVRFKVPQIGWNAVKKTTAWNTSPLNGMKNGELFYFVHSLYVRPKDKNIWASSTEYNGKSFCSSISKGNIFACQFHPERSGPSGLKVYENLLNTVSK